jgi:hypothetical protein
VNANNKPQPGLLFDLGRCHIPAETIEALIIRQSAFVRSVEFTDITLHPTLPTANERDGLGCTKMSTECCLPCPSFRYEQPSGMLIVHCGVIGNVAWTRSRGDRKLLQVSEKFHHFSGIDVRISAYYQHCAFFPLPARQPAAAGWRR